MKKALILSPHSDDAELGSGGYISKLLEEKWELFWIVFSTASESLPADLPKDILSNEFKSVARKLGIGENHFFIHDYTVRKLHEKRQNILENLVEIGNGFKPNLVIGPSLHDYHQDHQVIANEMIRAFKTKCSIICYELPWNNISFNNQMFVKLEERHIQTKLSILKEYNSQILKNRFYFDEEFIIGNARVKGTCISEKYAESFEVIRWIQ
jgi:LmbE family N-acetylglucosaminyl deacetylase